MLNLVRRSIRVGRVTEPHVADSAPLEGVVAATADRLHGSVQVRQIVAGSCNGCEAEFSAAFGPVYDVERFGVRLVASPRHADVLVVTGPLTKNMAVPLVKTFEATPGPKPVIASAIARATAERSPAGDLGRCNPRRCRDRSSAGDGGRCVLPERARVLWVGILTAASATAGGVAGIAVLAGRARFTANYPDLLPLGGIRIDDGSCGRQRDRIGRSVGNDGDRVVDPRSR